MGKFVISHPRLPSLYTPHNAISSRPVTPCFLRQLRRPPPSMGSKPRIPSVPAAVGRLRRRQPSSGRRLRKRQLRSADVGGGGDAAASTVSGKLAALRDLIPSESADAKPEQLFRETADYIVLLKTQVHVLQKLVDFYGSQSPENRDGVV